MSIADTFIKGFEQIVDWFRVLAAESSQAFQILNSIGFSFGGKTFGVWSFLTLGGMVVFFTIAVVKWVV